MRSDPVPCAGERQVLVPFDRREAMSLHAAAEIAGLSTETVRRWAGAHDLGRRVGGQWFVSRLAFRMFLDGDHAALRAYHTGQRNDPRVARYLDFLR